MSDVSPDHPRAESLKTRERLAKGLEEDLVTPEGMAAHGRGEAFDYILGEETTSQADKAIRCAAAKLLLAENPVFSVNGNVAALAASDVAELSEILDIKVEVNLFHRSGEREKKIADRLRKAGVSKVLGTEEEYSAEIPEIKSYRRVVDERGIEAADVVMVPLEDGDRTEALEEIGKDVVTIDLNPMSRTAKAADITIVDNLVRAMPDLVKKVKDLSSSPRDELLKIVDDFDNERNLGEMLKLMLGRLKKLSRG